MTTITSTIDSPQDLQHEPTVAALRRRTLVLLALIIPAIALTFILVYTQTRTPRVADLARKAISPSFNTDGRLWTSIDLPVTELEMQILETRDCVYRTYSDGKGAPVDFFVAFSEDNRKGTHPPDVCLEGSGWRIFSGHDRQLSIDGTLFRVRELVASSGGKFRFYVYFYKCGNVFTPSFYRQQVQIVWNGLTGRNASGALIRYSTPMRDAKDLPAARDRIDQLLKPTFPMIRDRLNLAAE